MDALVCPGADAQYSRPLSRGCYPYGEAPGHLGYVSTAGFSREIGLAPARVLAPTNKPKAQRPPQG